MERISTIQAERVITQPTDATERLTLIEKLEQERTRLNKQANDDIDVVSKENHAYQVGLIGGLTNAIDIVKQNSDWISVDERLPDSDCYVIVYCDGGNVTKSFFTTDREYLRLSRNSRYTRKAYGKNSGYFAISHDDGYKVTHWQPLPQPPSEVQE